MKPAFVYAGWVTAALLPLVYMVVWKVLTGPFSAEVQSMVVGAVVSGVLSAVTGFWLGSSAGSVRKTELAEGKGSPGAGENEATNNQAKT